MGKSAKLHKRRGKTTSTFAAQAKSQANSCNIPVQRPSVDKKQPQRVQKAQPKQRPLNARGEHVLGGADYVTLMMGGRAKAREEALKLPPPEKD